MMKKILFLFISAAAVACNPYDIDEVLLPREDISLTIKGQDQFIYNPKTCQISNNITTNEYRVFDDKLSEWFIVKCDVMPVYAGQEVTADLLWTTGRGNKSMDGLSFSVEKADGSGRIWMWCKQKSIGIVIKNL